MFIKPNDYVGVGINYRSEIVDDIIKNMHRIDFIEINTEKLFYDTSDKLQTITTRLPIVLHGLTLSLGSVAETINESYLDNLSKVVGKENCLWYSDHIATTRINNVDLRTLMPSTFTQEVAATMANKVKQLMKINTKPFLLENITYYFSMPDSQCSELEFIAHIVEMADCGILLDINNLYINSINHQYDPYNFIDRLPLDRVVEVHLAGCDYINNVLVDTHASRTKNEVLHLLQYLRKKIKIHGVIIERDDRLDNFNELMDEVALVKEIVQ